MIEAGAAIFGINPLFAIMLMGLLMIVNRAGASMVFFDVVGRFQAKRLVKDAETSMTLFNAIMLDAFANMQDSINVLGGTFSQFVESMLPMTEAIEEAEIQFEKFTHETGANLEITKQQIKDLGTEFGYSGDEALDAASRMAQLASVLGEGMTLTGTQLGMEFGLISGMGTEEAMTRLINLNQQIGFMQKGTQDLLTVEERQLKMRQNTIIVLDQLNTIENRSAATMEQITFVMNQFASQAHLAGESIAAMAAQSAALIEAGEEQGKAGRALKMVYARLGGDIGGATKHLNELGIATHDSSGNMRALSDILNDLNKEWETMEAGQKQNIAQTVAGNRHYTRFIKLMENYDRVQQLTLEGQFAMFPAIDEVENRLNSQIVAYQEAEATLFNMQATLGEKFLPAMTEALETQTNFTAVMVEFAEVSGPVGGFLYQFGEDMTNLVAPIMGVAVNIGALVVAMQTQKQVARAMAGEELVLSEAYGNAGLQYTNMARAMTELGLIRKEEIANVQMQTISMRILEETERKVHEDKLEAWVKQGIQRENAIVALQRKIKENAIYQGEQRVIINNIQETEARIKKAKTALAEYRFEQDQLTLDLNRERLALADLNIEREKEAAILSGSVYLAQKKQLQIREDAIQAQATLAKSIYLTSGLFMGLGSVIMMFSKSQDSMRAGMVLTTIGMGAMAVWQLKLIVGTKFLTKGIWASIVALGARNVQMWASIQAWAYLQLVEIVALANTIAITIAWFYQAGVAGTLTTMIGLLAMAYNALNFAMVGALVGSIVLLGAFVAAVMWTSKKLGEQLEVTEELTDAQHRYSASLFHEQLAQEAWTIDSITKAIDDKQAAIDRLAGSETQEAQDRIAAMEQEKNAYKDIKKLILANNLMMELGTEEARKGADLLLKAQQEMDKDSKRFSDPKFWGAGWKDKATWGFKEILQTGQFGVQIGRGILDGPGGESWWGTTEMKKNADALEQLKQDYAQAAEFIEITGVSSIEEFSQALASNYALWIDLGLAADEELTDVVSSITTASEALYDFNNAREELFYGMSASNITGDLVKQVVQRGVENLIAHTEVLMTNNFNGMTTQQAADEILTLIERGAGLEGYNLSTQSGQNMA